MAEVLGGLDQAQVAGIRAAREDHVRCVLTANWAALVRLLDEQAVVMPPNMEPLDTRAKFHAFLEGFPKIAAFRIDTIEIDGRADLAYDRGRYTMTAGGTSDRGSHLTLWRKQHDGSWKIFRDIWHSDLSAAS